MSTKVHPGDIVLFRITSYSPFHDKLIAFGEWILRKQHTKNSYYHVALVDTDICFILESVWPKARVSLFKREKNVIEIYRVRGVTKEQINEVIFWAHKHLGVWYDFGKLLFGLFPNKHKIICSTYVSDAYASAGIMLGNNSEKLLSPDEIAACALLEKIK